MSEDETLLSQLQNHKQERREKAKFIEKLELKKQLENTLRGLGIEKQVLENAMSIRRLSVQFNREDFFSENQSLKEKLTELENEKNISLQAILEALQLLRTQLISEQSPEITQQEELIKDLQEELFNTKQAIEQVKYEISSKDAEMQIAKNIETKRCKCLIF